MLNMVLFVDPRLAFLITIQPDYIFTATPTFWSLRTKYVSGAALFGHAETLATHDIIHLAVPRTQEAR